MGALQTLASKFVISPPPADYAGRLDFLAQHLQYVEQIIAKLPVPDYVNESEALADTRSVRDRLERLTLSNVVTMVLPGSVMRNTMIVLWDVVNYGAKIHAPSWRQAALTSGFMTVEQLNQDYMARIGTLQAMMRIAQSGALDPLFAKKADIEGSTSGLGAEPISTLTIVAILLVVALLIALGYAIYQWTMLSLNNAAILKRADRLCFDQAGNPIPAVQKDCVELLQGMNRNLGTASAADPLTTVIKYVAIGGVVYLGIALLPDLLRKGLQRSSAA